MGLTPITLEPPIIAPLESGDELTQREFHRRYSAMPHLKKAELIDGTVFMPSPVSHHHAKAHQEVVTWLGVYAANHPGVHAADNVSVILDDRNEVQPDVCLRWAPERGGRTRIDDEGYVRGAPELVVEVALSSASIDLRRKRDLYLLSGVKEYLVWLVLDSKIHWWESIDGEFKPLDISPETVIESHAFPGLRLDTGALLRGDQAMVLEKLKS